MFIGVLELDGITAYSFLSCRHIWCCVAGWLIMLVLLLISCFSTHMLHKSRRLLPLWHFESLPNNVYWNVGAARNDGLLISLMPSYLVSCHFSTHMLHKSRRLLPCWHFESLPNNVYWNVGAARHDSLLISLMPSHLVFCGWTTDHAGVALNKSFLYMHATQINSTTPLTLWITPKWCLFECWSCTAWQLSHFSHAVTFGVLWLNSNWSC